VHAFIPHSNPSIKASVHTFIPHTSGYLFASHIFASVSNGVTLSSSTDCQVAPKDTITHASNSQSEDIPDRTSHIVPSPRPKSTAKKYKPVAFKVRPVIGELPGKFRIVRNIIGDPLANLPVLPHKPPLFRPYGRFTEERRKIFDKNNAGFLLPEERKLLHYFMCVHEDGFAWDDTERGHFREDFFPPISA
jgi:hypothetical protein